ncbi:MAG: hypothetical protein ABF633_01310 [Clostridium sp.]|uniref:hypothetical protein n=1 Tax=Clostridium sp. TaxID=1506 RepID=UPI0039E957B5
MFKFKKVLIPVVALGIVFTVAFYGKSSVKTTNEKVLTTANTTIQKPEIHKGIAGAKANTPYSIKAPTAKIDDLKLVNMKSDKHTFKNKDVHIAYSFYKGNNNDEELTIQQVDSTEKNPLIDTSNEKIKLSDGTDAWISDEMNGKGYIHVLFTRNGQNFDVMGFDLSKDRLISIADSLK